MRGLSFVALALIIGCLAFVGGCGGGNSDSSSAGSSTQMSIRITAIGENDFASANRPMLTLQTYRKGNSSNGVVTEGAWSLRAESGDNYRCMFTLKLPKNPQNLDNDGFGIYRPTVIEDADTDNELDLDEVVGTWWIDGVQYVVIYYQDSPTPEYNGWTVWDFDNSTYIASANDYYTHINSYFNGKPMQKENTTPEELANLEAKIKAQIISGR